MGLWQRAFLHGANIPATFVDGDRFGARARADGTVEVYRNGVLLGTRDVTSWPYYANGGYIGLWFINAGAATYLYDRANRMISTTVGGVTTQFNYNGDGTRLKQIVNGVVTTYTQDLAAPLPVVLQAQTGTTITKYLYSLGTRPLAQNSTAWEYLLPDALGSVRQIVDANGNVTLVESYEPYGSVLTSTGTASSIFAYAGEQADTTGLIYLRARYMQPMLGMFLSHDPWSGEAMRPGSMNGFNYAEGNPVQRIDPTGHGLSDIKCLQWIFQPDSIPGDLTAEDAINTCRNAYSQDTIKAVLGENACNYQEHQAQSATELLWDYFCNKGTTYAIFYGGDRLTQELARSTEIHQVRFRFYETGNIDLQLWPFNEPEFSLATIDSLLLGDLSITHFMGSFDVKVTEGAGRVHFLVHNKTDLRSGTHFQGRFEPAYSKSVEELVKQHEHDNWGKKPLKEFLDDKYGVISILQEQLKGQGANRHQLFTWSERKFDCWVELFWPVYLPFLDIGDYGLPIEYDPRLVQ